MGSSRQTHDIVGTKFRPATEKVGNEELENWLLKLLSPKIHFRFYEVDLNDSRVVLLEIERAMRTPVQFYGQVHTSRVLQKEVERDFPNKERDLWRIFDQIPFESGAAAEQLTSGEVITFWISRPCLIFSSALCPSVRSLLAVLQSDNLIQSTATGRWDITNLGAILFGKRLDAFGPLSRKAVRVVRYRGNSRIETIKEQPGGRGYASGFEGWLATLQVFSLPVRLFGKLSGRKLRLIPSNT